MSETAENETEKTAQTILKYQTVEKNLNVEEVQTAAYHYFEQRMREGLPGDKLSDWLMAERIVRERHLILEVGEARESGIQTEHPIDEEHSEIQPIPILPGTPEIIIESTVPTEPEKGSAPPEPVKTIPEPPPPEPVETIPEPPPPEPVKTIPEPPPPEPIETIPEPPPIETIPEPPPPEPVETIPEPPPPEPVDTIPEPPPPEPIETIPERPTGKRTLIALLALLLFCLLAYLIYNFWPAGPESALGLNQSEPNQTPSTAIDDPALDARVNKTVIYYGPARTSPLPGQEKELETIVEYLKKFPQKSILVIGHANSVGQPKSEREIAGNRAKNIKKAILSRLTFQPDIRLENHSSDDPVIRHPKNYAQAGQNRRVGFRVIANEPRK